MSYNMADPLIFFFGYTVEVLQEKSLNRNDRILRVQNQETKLPGFKAKTFGVLEVAASIGRLSHHNDVILSLVSMIITRS